MNRLGPFGLAANASCDSIHLPHLSAALVNLVISDYTPTETTSHRHAATRHTQPHG